MRLIRTIVSVPLMMLMASSAAFGHYQSSPEGMVRVDEGVYQPLYVSPGNADGSSVMAFFIDIDPVTNVQFLEFVTENPRWKKSLVSPLFAEPSYLQRWASDTDIGTAGENQPVTNISWFAAKAYAQWKGNRLPTIAEWEYVASAGMNTPFGSQETDYEKRILELTNRAIPNPLPEVGASDANYWGVRDLHGLLWEWVSDFNSMLITGESRADASLERKLYCGSGVIGASDFTDYAAFMRFAFRGSVSAAYANLNLGFRTVRSVHL
jgi:sulfatase modifying factor 1